MGEQAEENVIEDTDLELGEELEEEEGEQLEPETAESEESEDLDVIFDGEDEPTSKTVPLNRFLQKTNKLNGRVKERDAEIERLQLEKEQAIEEAKLLRLGLQQKMVDPKPEDFDTDAEYEAAQRSYNEAKRREEREAMKREVLQEISQQSSKGEKSENLKKAVSSHYERADKLQVKDFDESEGRAIDILGSDLTEFIIANTDNSEVLLYALGKPANEAKAKRIVELSKTNLARCTIEIGRLDAKAKLVPGKRSLAPDPETEVSGGGGIKKTVSPYLEGAKFT